MFPPGRRRLHELERPNLRPTHPRKRPHRYHTGTCALAPASLRVAHEKLPAWALPSLGSEILSVPITCASGVCRGAASGARRIGRSTPTPLVDRDVCMFSSNLDDAWWCWTQISRSLRQSTRELMILKLTCTGRAPYNCKLQTRTYTFPPRPQTHAQCQLASERARMIQLQTPTRPRIPRCVCRASPSDHQSWSKHTRSRSYS